MAGRHCWSFPLVCFLLLLQQDGVTSQSLLLRTTSGGSVDCRLTNTYLPMTCTATADSSFFVEDPGTFTDFDVQFCGEVSSVYFLFASGGLSFSQLYRVPLSFDTNAIPVLMSDHPPVISFDLCCKSVIYASSHQIFADNIEDDAELRVAATLYADPEERTIQHVEVCCHRGRYRILFSINDDGLYSMGMDGTNVVQVLDYGGARTIIDMDYNCDPNNGRVALASGMEVRLFDLDGTDTASLPMMYTDTLLWTTNNLGTPDDAVQVSLATSTRTGPLTVTLWGPASEERVWVTVSEGSSQAADASLPDTEFQAAFIGASAGDVLSPCPAAEICPCSETDDYQHCCIGLCLPRNEIEGREYSCYCNNPDTTASDQCQSEGTFGSIPTTCRLDLVGAIKCQGGTREWSSSIYALSLYSTTGICPTAYSGKEAPMPRGATPFRTHGFHSSGYVFRAPTQFRDYGGERYGLYTVTTGTAVNGADGGLTDSLPVVFQERSKDLYVDYVTKVPILGENDYLRVNVRRPCDARRVRWRFNGRTLHQYKGKLTIPFKPFTSKQEGVYEAYFQGRIKKHWRVIIWVTAATAGCSDTCTSNGGFCSYDGGCICPPGKSGVDCENNCPKGKFGVIGGCDFSCREVFGDDCADCQNILLCLEAPAGCHCYPGYQLPNCTPCPRGYWGLNCANECAAGAACDPYFGNIGEE